MPVIISPRVASIGIIATGLDPVTYPGMDGFYGAHGVEYPNNGYTATDPPTLPNANRVYDSESFQTNRHVGILLPISYLGIPTVFSSGNSMPQYRHPRWSRF